MIQGATIDDIWRDHVRDTHDAIRRALALCERRRRRRRGRGPAQDADIVRRIRARCPDNRFGGSFDAELVQLFQRNKQVLARCDEDVIAAMTRPR